MKRTLLILLAITILPLAVFATAQNEGAGEMTKKYELKYWGLFGGSDGQVMELMVQQFNDSHENISVTYNVTQNYYEALTAAIAGGNAPDVAISHTRNLPAFADERLLYTLDEPLAKKGLGESSFIPLAWKGGTIQGKRYALPLDIIIAMVLYYNEDHFKQAGMQAVEPKDGADLMAMAKKLQAATGKVGMDVPLTGIRLYRYWFSALNQKGGQLLSNDLKSAAFNTPTGVEALQYWVDAVYKHGVAADRPLGEGEGFRFGSVSMSLDGIWNVRGFREQEGLNFDLFAMPALFQPGNRSFFSNSHNFILPKPRTVDEKRRDAALEFIIWMSNSSRTWSEAASMVSARADVVSAPDFLQIEFMDRLLKQAEFAVYPPPIKQTGQVETAIVEALEFAMAREKTPAQALKDAADKVNQVLR